MKILTVKNQETAFLKYVYYSMKCINYKPPNHSRQWIAKYSKFTIDLPDFQTQQEIVAILDEKLLQTNKLKQASREQLTAIDKLFDTYIHTYIHTYIQENLSERWEWKTLGEIVELVYGNTLVKASRKKGNIPVFGSNGQIDYHDAAMTNDETIIIGRKGSVGSVHFSPTGCWVIDTAYFVKPVVNVDIKYLYYLMKSLKLDLMNKSSAIPGLNRNDVYKLLVQLPSYSEQVDIANFLDIKEKHINTLKPYLQNQSTYINQLFESYCRGELRSSKNIGRLEIVPTNGGRLEIAPTD